MSGGPFGGLPFGGDTDETEWPSGSPAVTGTGTLVAAAATCSGTGTVTLAVPAPISPEETGAVDPVGLYGYGWLFPPDRIAFPVRGRGRLTARRATLHGTGTITIQAVSGSGAVTAARAAIMGVGTVGVPPVTGRGALGAHPATITGYGPYAITIDDYELVLLGAF